MIELIGEDFKKEAYCNILVPPLIKRWATLDSEH
jgi:hypothetical protein